jgi:hypothetical protein
LICRRKNKEELFNLHHSQAHNVIEHVFGVFSVAAAQAGSFENIDIINKIK